MNFFGLTTPEKDGQLHLDFNDVIVRQMTVTFDGKIMFPPPPVKVSAAPSTPAPPAQPNQATPEVAPAKLTKYLWLGLAAVIFGALIYVAPPGMTSHFMVFALACVVGFTLLLR